MLELIIGKDWVQNRNEILNRIAEDVKNRRGGRILMVPELISQPLCGGRVFYPACPPCG